MTIDRGLSQIWKRAGINCTESSGGIPTSGSVGATPATQRPTQRPLHPDCASFAIVLLSHTSFTHFFHTLLSHTSFTHFFHTLLSHTSFTHFFHTLLSHTWRAHQHSSISIHRDTDATSHAALKQHCKQHCKDAQGHAQGHLNDLASECPRSIVWSVLRARERARHNALEAPRRDGDDIP